MELDTSKIVIKPTQVYYLKMDHRPVEPLANHHDLLFEELKKPIDLEEYLSIYRTVGLKFNWLDRLVMPRKELHDLVNVDKVHVYFMKINHEPAGFLELVHENEYIELLYFGLFPDFIGKGLGKPFLARSIDQAWSFNPKWIQLNTCDLDHPNALPNYRKMGFRDYKMATEDRKTMGR